MGSFREEMSLIKLAAISLLSISFLSHAVAEREDTLEEHHEDFQFLLAVNDTWASCFSLVSTPMMSPNRSERITVDKCDAAPLIFNVNKNGKPDWSNQWSKYSLWLEFRSSVIEDASPPTCTINFNGTFVLPGGEEEEGEPSDDLRLFPLPGCFTGD